MSTNVNSSVFHLPIVDRPADHPHAVVGQRGDWETGDQGKGIESGDKDLAESFIPLIVGVLSAQLNDTVHGDRDAHVKNVRASQCADEEFQWLPLLLLSAHAQDSPGIGQDGHTWADQPGQCISADDLIVHDEQPAGESWRGVEWWKVWEQPLAEAGARPEQAFLQGQAVLPLDVLRG